MKSPKPAAFSFSPRALTTLSILAGLGLVISLFQVSHFFEVRQGLAGFDSFCNIGATFNCNAIDASPYAELFNGLPLSAAAAGWFLAILILTLLARSAEFTGVLYPWVLGMSAVGSVVSLVYLGIMLSILKVGCLLCLGVDLINWSMLGILLWNRPKPDVKIPGDLKSGAWTTLVSVVLMLIIAKGMQGEAIPQAQLAERIQSILDTQPVAMNLPPQLLAVGNPSARITIVKFSDFQCPSCRMGAQTLHPVLKRYADQVRFVYRNFPLDSACNRMITRPMHVAACELAAGAICAEGQKKFEEYYQKVFEDQSALKSGSALEIAKSLGLDAAQFESCLKDPATQARLNQDIEEGITLNVESTPTFFVNGKKVSGAQPPQVWNAVFETLLR